MKYIAIPKYDSDNDLHTKIADTSKKIQSKGKKKREHVLTFVKLESKLNRMIHILFS